MIKLHARAAALLQEHSDVVLFANYRISTVKADVGFNKKVNRAMGSGERVIHTAERPAFLERLADKAADRDQRVWTRNLDVDLATRCQIAAELDLLGHKAAVLIGGVCTNSTAEVILVVTSTLSLPELAMSELTTNGSAPCFLLSTNRSRPGTCTVFS